MKIYEILDYEENKSIGVLLYFEKKREFIIELQDNLDAWTAPLLFSNMVNNNIYTATRELSRMWVKERIIPSGRQNISDILKNHRMEAYDEMKFLELAKGKCSQDSLYINKINELPEYVLNRSKHNVVECVACDNNMLLCFFADDLVKKIDMKDLIYVDYVDKILKNDELYKSCAVGVGGYYVTFNDSIDIPAKTLYETGSTIPLALKDFVCFAKHNLLDTTESCKALDCSRQNVSYLIKQQQLSPVKENVKGNIYLKGDVLRNMW